MPVARLNIGVLQIMLSFIIVLSSFTVSFAQAAMEDQTERPANLARYNIDSIAFKDSIRPAFNVRRIVFEGNKRTRDIILLRELTFEVGDSIRIRDFPPKFEEAENRLMNTRLFHEAHISVLQFDEWNVDIKVVVDERNYIWPFPHLKPVDRNISQWLFKEKASFSRVDYGVKLHLDNITGNNDKLRFYFITGYTRQLQLSYSRPYIDKNLKWGIDFDILLGKNHEINYNTIDDKQAFVKFRDNVFARNFFRANIEIINRPAFYTWHTFGVAYNQLRVNDSVLKLNPNFFNSANNRIHYPEFYYKLTHREFDYNPYPTRGHAAELEILQQGLSKEVHVTQLTLKGVKYWPITDKVFYSIGAMGSIKVPFQQPYYFSPLLGYGDFNLRGYEFYVVDGVAGGVLNATIAQQLTNFKIHIPGTKWLTPRLIPLKIYGKLFGNAGYGYNPNPGNNRLDDKLLFGGGFGIDVVTMYDFNLKIDFSFNQLGQNGIYLQKKSTFQ